MRFGIYEMQLGDLIPSGISLAQAQEYMFNFSNADFVPRLVQQDFKIIELNGDLPIFFPNCYAPAAIERLSTLKSEHDLAYTVHLPLWSVEPSTPQSPVRQGSVDAIIQVIQTTQMLDPEVYVLHATGALASEFYQMGIPAQAKPMVLRLFQANAIASLTSILAKTGLPPRKLAVETIEFPFDLTLEMAEMLDCSMCVDAGHILAGFAGDLDLFEVLEQCRPRLAEIHLHDSPWYRNSHKIGYGKDHQPLGHGDLDVTRLIQWLQQVHFDGPIIFELTPKEARISLELIQKLTPGLENA